MVVMYGLITIMTTPTKQYDTVIEYYSDLLSWKSSKAFYEALNLKVPPEPVWNPSPNYIEYD